MVDDFKSIRENLFKVLTGIRVNPTDDGETEAEGDLDEDDDGDGRGRIDAGAARALIGALFARAGKGKDEVVQIIAREIGNAVAAMLKEPLSQLAKHQKLQISFEFVPKQGHERDVLGDDADEATPRPARARKPAAARGAKRTAAAKKTGGSGR